MTGSAPTLTTRPGDPSPRVPTAVPRAEVVAALRGACGRLAPVWPLESFVAVNPYLGLVERSFDEVAQRLADVAGARTTLPAAAYLGLLEEGRITRDDVAWALTAHHPAPVPSVDTFLRDVAEAAQGDEDAVTPRVATVADVAAQLTGHDWVGLSRGRVSAWAAAYFDTGQALWRSSDPARPLYDAWRFEASVDRTPEVMGLRGFRRHVRALPEDPIAAAEEALAVLDVPADGRELYLHRLLLRVGGWAAYAARTVWDRGLRGDHDDDTLVQFLAVLLSWELCLLRSLDDPRLVAAWEEAMAELPSVAGDAALRPPLARTVVLQHALDRAEQRRLVAQLSAGPATASGPTGRPDAQAVFCIDVRSEVFRRHLETVAGDVETLGFAGFFGFPLEYVPLAHRGGGAHCPVLLTPAHTVFEAVADPARHEQAVRARRRSHHVARAWKSFKMGAISCFSFVGPVGLAYLPKLFTDSYGWSRPTRHPEDEGLPRRAVAAKGPDLGGTAGPPSQGIPLHDRVELAEGALRAMSLTDGFAPLVLVAGHGATTVNNPYDTGLDCGACGGRTGEANARIAAAVLNDADVRRHLAQRGIAIPDDTWFVAAKHDTTTDVVTLYDREDVPADHSEALAALERALADAGRRTRDERATRLGIPPGPEVDAAVRARSRDWAQVRPEWGLAGCRAFVVAPRDRTRGVDLAGRTFLHSYDWRADEGFGVLELIMTAPMVVASWISLQYYASTVDNDLFGSGNKTLHNVVGRVGVLEGNAGDLRVGLPWQSVHDGDVLQHEPLRLTVVIAAPIDAMTDVLARHASVRDLCDNGWLQLLAMDDDGTVSHRYVGGLRWEPALA